MGVPHPDQHQGGGVHGVCSLRKNWVAVLSTALTRNQAQILADFICTVRPDWDKAGVIVALGHARNLEPRADAFSVALAAIRAARSNENRTPVMIGRRGPHWMYTGGATNYLAEPQRGETCSICYLERERCLSRWNGDHVFESLEQAAARAIRRADNPHKIREYEEIEGRRIVDVVTDLANTKGLDEE